MGRSLFASWVDVDVHNQIFTEHFTHIHYAILECGVAVFFAQASGIAIKHGLI
jgi:hypothetical protein